MTRRHKDNSAKKSRIDKIRRIGFKPKMNSNDACDKKVTQRKLIIEYDSERWDMRIALIRRKLRNIWSTDLSRY
jgi:hypothetical protein